MMCLVLHYTVLNCMFVCYGHAAAERRGLANVREVGSDAEFQRLLDASGNRLIVVDFSVDWYEAIEFVIVVAVNVLCPRSFV